MKELTFGAMVLRLALAMLCGGEIPPLHFVSVGMTHCTL